eukprot:1103627-Pleurochrysis_carterae.AAC.1
MREGEGGQVGHAKRTCSKARGGMRSKGAGSQRQRKSHEYGARAGRARGRFITTSSGSKSVLKRGTRAGDEKQCDMGHPEARERRRAKSDAREWRAREREAAQPCAMSFVRPRS